jgi:hypothetical protein
MGVPYIDQNRQEPGTGCRSITRSNWPRQGLRQGRLVLTDLEVPTKWMVLPTAQYQGDARFKSIRS